MALTGVNDKYLVTFKGTLCGQTILNTFWYDLFAKGPIASVDDAYTVLAAGLGTITGLRDDFRGACPNNYMLDEIWLQKVYDQRVMKKVVNVALPGTHGIDAPTANLAAVITRRAELADRRSVSTLHVPMPDPTVVLTDGEITDVAYKTSLGDLAVEIKNDIDGAGAFAGAKFRPVVFQPGPPIGPTTRYIVQTVVNFTARVMGRRTVGRGI